jgi:plasmid maintenance system antidote protein VapI
MLTQTPPSAADLRAALARYRIPIYVLAAAVGQHPARVGAALSERAPLTPERARRIAAAIERLAREPRMESAQ